MGASCADVDGDGDVDLFVSNRGPDVLYLNNGDGTFSIAPDSPDLTRDGFSASAGFCDLDGDGLPELYVTQYILWSTEKELKCGTGLGSDYYTITTILLLLIGSSKIWAKASSRTSPKKRDCVPHTATDLEWSLET